MNDYISRQAAINTALNMYHRCEGSLDDYRALMVESLEVLTGMPKAERWIPCAERLPEEERMVIVTIRGHDVIRCEDGETLEEAIDRVMQMLRVSVGFMYDDGWFGVDGYAMMVQPVAWMPLPEPWKGEE